jgi:hypothetical protein
MVPYQRIMSIQPYIELPWGKNAAIRKDHLIKIHQSIASVPWTDILQELRSTPIEGVSAKLPDIGRRIRQQLYRWRPAVTPSRTGNNIFITHVETLFGQLSKIFQPAQFEEHSVMKATEWTLSRPQEYQRAWQNLTYCFVELNKTKTIDKLTENLLYFVIGMYEVITNGVLSLYVYGILPFSSLIPPAQLRG